MRDNKGRFIAGHKKIGMCGAPKGVRNSIKTEFKKGIVPWNKVERAEKSCVQCKEIFLVKPSKISQKFCSRICADKGSVGRKMDNETKEKISGALKGKLNHKPVSGEKHHKWKGGITTQDRKERIQFRYKIQKKIFERDDFTCGNCNVRGGNLQVDHIKSWAKFPELRFDFDNCITLCAKCHYEKTFNKKMPIHIKGWGHNLLKQ